MQPFNLAETKMLERRVCREQLERRARGICMLLAATIAVVAGICAARSVAKARIADLQSELSAVRVECSAARRKASEAEAVSLRYMWQRRLLQKTQYWLGSFSAVLACAPDDLWIRSVQSADKGSALTMEGTASSYESISAFNSALRQKPVFSDVRLGGIKTSGSAESRSLDFTFLLQVRSPDERQAASRGAAPARVPSVGG